MRQKVNTFENEIQQLQAQHQTENDYLKNHVKMLNDLIYKNKSEAKDLHHIKRFQKMSDKREE